jgi:hypothetical protein
MPFWSATSFRSAPSPNHTRLSRESSGTGVRLPVALLVRDRVVGSPQRVGRGGDMARRSPRLKRLLDSRPSLRNARRALLGRPREHSFEVGVEAKGR